MKKLKTFDLWQRPLAGMYKELLAAEGIACIVRNEQLSMALGEIPFTECYPELWITDDETYLKARLLIDRWLAEQDTNVESWTCLGCGEVLEAQFNVCWACRSQRT